MKESKKDKRKDKKMDKEDAPTAVDENRTFDSSPKVPEGIPPSPKMDDGKVSSTRITINQQSY